MREKSLFLVLFLGMSINTLEANAVEAYIYCADANKNWRWLKNDGNYVSVVGQFKTISKDVYQKKVNFTFFELHDKYFLSLDPINLFQKACQKYVGENYTYAQAAISSASHWYPIGKSLERMGGGHIEINIDNYKMNDFQEHHQYNMNSYFNNLSLLILFDKYK